MKILIDNGHGNPPLTGGKCSPDRRLLEYVWAREIAKRLEAELTARGYDAQRIVPEDIDIPLNVRTRRVNAICKTHGAKNCLLVSIHINAATSDGKWHDAQGWCGFVSQNASADSKLLAQLLYKQAERQGKVVTGNRYVPPCKYWVKSLAMCRDTNCPAVLTENLFMDNRADTDFLLSENGKRVIVQMHRDAIIEYIAKKGGQR